MVVNFIYSEIFHVVATSVVATSIAGKANIIPWFLAKELILTSCIGQQIIVNCAF